MADRRRSRSGSRNAHVLQNYSYDTRGGDDNESDEYPESIGMEDRSEDEGLGPRRRDIVSRNRGYRSDEEQRLQMSRYSRISEREFRNRSFLYYEEHRSDTGYRNMGYRNTSTEIQNVDYRQQLVKRQQTYEMSENRAVDNGRVEDNQSPDTMRMSYRETGFYVEQDQNERAYPENMEISHADRGLPTIYTQQYPAPGAIMQMDRGPQPSLQLQHGYQYSTAWHTQAPFVVVQHPQVQQQPPQQEEEEKEKKPRKVWWYTTCRVFSAILIILTVVSDWLQYSDMSDPIGDTKDSLTGKMTVCLNGHPTKKDEDDVKQFMYFTIAGTVIAALQMANIIYQIVQNHRLGPEIEVPNYIDERTEIFLVNAFVKIPQTFLLHRFEKSLPDACFACKIGWDAGKIRRFLNGLAALLSSGWRYLTNLKVSSSNKKFECSKICDCSKLCEKCAKWLGDCVKKCLLGLLKCCCPCCCCCIDCTTFFPCCCCYLTCENCKMSTRTVCDNCKLCDPEAPSIFADMAALPTGLYTFLYTSRVMRYFCDFSSIMSVYKIYKFLPDLIQDKVFSWIWDKIF